MNEALWTLRGATLGGRVRDVTLSIERGVTAVLGHSGAGKTSLLNLLVAFERADAGVVESHIERGAHARSVYWAPQDDGLWPHLTAREHLEAMSAAEAGAWLSEFDLAGRAGALPQTLSQGERSRLSVARALAADAAALVMDEPLAHVDPARVGKYWGCVRRHLARTAASLVFATHVPAIVLAEAQRVICLSEGRLIYAGAVEDLYWRPPTPELAACLGESNWLEPAEMRVWMRREEPAARCLRPEQIALHPEQGGVLVVESSRFHGSVAEVLLRHEPTGASRLFWHRPSGNHLPAGVRVVLEVIGH